MTSFCLIWFFTLLLQSRKLLSQDNIAVPDTPETRNLLSWTVFDAPKNISSIFTSGPDRTSLYAITSQKTLFKINANGTNGTIAGAKNVIFGNEDTGVSVLIFSNQSLKIDDDLYMKLDVHTLKIPMNVIVFARIASNNKYCIYMNNKTGVSNIIYDSLTFMDFSADLMSCTTLRNTCWIYKNNSLYISEWESSSCLITVQKSIDIEKTKFVSLSVYRDELWLVQSDGRIVWRRIGITDATPQGTRWLKFKSNLPSSVVSVAIGSRTVFVLMESGVVARFNGFRKLVTNDTYHKFSKVGSVHTYDGQPLYAIGRSPLTSSHEKMNLFKLDDQNHWRKIQSSRKVAAVKIEETTVFYFKYDETDRVTNMNANGDSNTRTIQSDSNMNLDSLKAECIFGENNKDVLLVCSNNTISEVPAYHYFRFSGGFQCDNGLSYNDIIIVMTCGKTECWILTDSGKVATTDEQRPCNSIQRCNFINSSLILSHIAVNKGGSVIAIEKDTQDVFYRIGIDQSNQRGTHWINIPGVKLSSVALDDKRLYGSFDNEVLYMYLHGNTVFSNEASWSSWSTWSDCDRSCGGGVMLRNRTCNSNMLASCSGDTSQTKRCNIHRCEDTCQRAFDSNNQKRCCYFPSIIDVSSQLTHYNACFPSNQTVNATDESRKNSNIPDCYYVCPLDINGTEYGACVGNRVWNEWSNWSACSHSCFTGIKTRYRTENITRFLNGRTVYRNESEQSFCNQQPCANATTSARRSNGSLTYCFFNNTGAGSPFGECWLTAGKTYECFLDRFGNETGTCEPINGNYTNWSTWSSCSHDCFSGIQTRNRTCVNAKYYGICLDPKTTDLQYCNRKPCYDLSNCTKAIFDGNTTCCMLGMELNDSRTHYKCEQNINVLSDGKYRCPIDRYGMNYGICEPIHGKWSPWSNWTECKKVHTCKDTIKEQYRNCSQPEYGGDPCQGPAVNTTACVMENCPPDTFWSEWKLDKPCSVTCGEGKEVWKRDCMHINGNMVLESECQGIARSTNSCRQMDCPGFFLGDLGENCSSSCSRRNLTCRWLEKPFPNDYTEELSKLNVNCLSESNGIEIWKEDWQPAYNQSRSECVGFKNVKYSRCSQSQQISESKVKRLCRCIYLGDLKYSEWSAWSGCSAYCGSAYKTRKRICLSNNPADCLETLSQNATCDLETCPDDEGFSSWSSWSKCSAHCNAGLAHRYRICNNKIYCFGHVNESKLCNTQPCQVHGNWTEWSELSVCSKSCGHGNKERIRSCTNPAPLYGGNNCTGDAIETFPCNTFNCTVDIGYTPWSIWGECSTSCGMGVKKRYRSCKGVSCNGTLEDTGPCDNQLCPVDGGWTDYTVWSPCSKTCGGGKRTRYRYCTSPKPRNGGLHCDGDSSQEEECNFHICPVHGMWGAWGNWSLCDKPCNNGTKRRVRFCDNPKPQYNGRYCIGKGEMKQICNSHPCKAVSIGVYARFWNETYIDELAYHSSIEFKNLESKIGRNVMDLYRSSDGNIESHVESVSVQFFSNGSVYSNFTVNFTEVSSYELIILVTSIQEKDLLNSMPVNFFQINADDIPSSPKSIAASAVNETCIRVKWSNFTSSITSFNLTAFTVIYRDTSTTKWKSVLVNPTVVEAYLTRLQPYTLYTLRVTALTYDALGIPSDLQDVQTLEGVPTEPPGNTSCRATSSSVIFCSWSDVPYQSQNGFITKFLIKYRKYSDPGSLIISSNNPWYNVSFPATANSGTVSGLEFFTRYELQIHGVTSAGVGAGQWLTVKTEEDVPSSAPLNIKAKSYFSNKYLDISWDSIPSDKWNGRPLGIVLKYSITRKASTSIVGWPTVVIDKKYDERFHRITGLEANWEVTITLQGKTAAGDGVKSAPVVGETCRCDQKLYTAWYEKNPYIFKQGNAVKGIYPDLLSSMVPQICGKCDAYGSTLVYFDRTKRGQNSVRTSESDMTAKLSDDVHFNVPAGGNKEQTLYQGQYQYINVIDSTGSVFVVVDQSKASKTSAMVQSLGRVWPLLVVSILMMILAGILLWMVDQFENPEELEKGRFFAGSFRGFWWAFVSMTTLGYGDIAPRGTLGRMIGVIWTSIGLIINGILISTISTALTVISVKQQTMLYGANVSAVSNSSQYILGIRRNANMNSTGQHYLTSKAAIDALIQRKVQGTLLDLNEAANMQTVISKNGLKIVKVIESTSGIGMILSGEMISFHSKIRSYVSDNSAYITGLTKNYTKTVEIPAVKARDKSVTGMFSSSSDTFKSLLKGSLFILAGAVVLGLLWSFVIRIYLKRRSRVHPQRSPEQALQAYYNKWTDEIIAHGEDFVRDLKENWQDMEVRHGRERFRLLSKHFQKKSFGATAWMKYKSFDQQYIIKKMRIEEAFLENLHRKRHRKMIKKIKLMDITEDDLRVDHHEYKM